MATGQRELAFEMGLKILGQKLTAGVVELPQLIGEADSCMGEAWLTSNYGTWTYYRQAGDGRICLVWNLCPGEYATEN